jgi:predicted Zn-dependent protease
MKRASWLLPLTLLPACDPVTVPAREPTEVFDFRLVAGTDSLVLRWPNRSEIRVFLQPSSDRTADLLMEAAFRHAATAWEDISLYGDFDFTQVRMVEAADVVVTWSGVNLPVEISECPPGGSNAFTTFCLTAERDRLKPFPLRGTNAMPSSVRFLVTIRMGESTNRSRVFALLTHELGHVLGIARHSPNQADLMFTEPAGRDVPNARDRATLHVLYQTRADIRP